MSSDHQRILVTGASGMIGTRVVERLRTHHDIVGVDLKRNPWNSAVDELIRVIDVRDMQSLETVPGPIDGIIHLAANARVYNLVQTPQLAFDNIHSTFSILEYARLTGVKWLIFASSREVYGNLDSEAISEDSVVISNIESAYAASKIAGEAFLHAYARCYGLEFVTLRFSNVYGMYDDSDRVIPLWIRQAAADEPITVYGADKLLDFTYIDDAVDAITLTMQRMSDVNGQTFNIASGHGTKLLTVGNQIKQLLDSSSRLEIRSNRVGEVVNYVADIQAAQRWLNYQPRVMCSDGLEMAVRWCEMQETTDRYQSPLSDERTNPEGMIHAVEGARYQTGS